MTDKEKVRFKVKFPKLNLSNARLDAIKLNLADDADDAAIDAKLDEVNGYVPYEEIAREDDRLRTPPKPTPAPPAPAPPTPAPAPGDDAPAWAQGLVKTVETLTSELNAIKSGKATDTRKSQLETALKDVSEGYRNTVLKAFDRMKFEKDEDFTSYLEEVKTDSAGFVQEEANTGLGNMKPPTKPAGGNGKTASKEEVDAVVNAIMPK